MEKEAYRERMLETSLAIGDVILGYLAPLQQEHPGLHELCTELCRKKIGTFETRAYFMRYCFEVCAGRAWTEEARHACAAVELELASMYYTNRIFDDKGGREILSDPHGQVIASMITHGLASKAMASACQGLPQDTFREIMNVFEDVNQVFYVGQYFEVKENLYRPGIALDWDALVAGYSRRAYGVNASFYEKMAMIGGTLGEGTSIQIAALAEFGKQFGIAQQIVNDIGDFVPPAYNGGTEEKLPEDAYSDIRHKKLTLPVIFTLVRGQLPEQERLAALLSQERITDEECLEMTRLFVQNDAIAFAQNEARTFMRLAQSALDVLEPSVRSLHTRTGIIKSCGGLAGVYEGCLVGVDFSSVSSVRNVGIKDRPWGSAFVFRRSVLRWREL